MTRTYGTSVLNAVVDPEIQETWVDDSFDPHPDELRLMIARRRRAMRGRYERLRSTPGFDEAFADLVAYVRSSIIHPSHTDGRFWTVSALPSTGREKGLRRLFTVNCGNVETFVVFQGSEDESPWWFLNVDPAKLATKKSSLPARFKQCVSNGSYRSTGPVKHIEGYCGQLEEYLRDFPSLAPAARSLALGLMRSGQSLFAKYHCDDLADDILVALSDATSAPSR